jgi:hypothetical protein
VPCIYTKFHKDWFNHSKVEGVGDTQTIWRSHKRTFIFFFQNNGDMLKVPVSDSDEPPCVCNTQHHGLKHLQTRSTIGCISILQDTAHTRGRIRCNSARSDHVHITKVCTTTTHNSTLRSTSDAAQTSNFKRPKRLEI